MVIKIKKIQMKKIVLIIIIIISSCTAMFSQDSTKQLVFEYPNAIYGTGAIGGLWGTFNLNYERQVRTTKINLFKSVGVRFGSGYWATWGSTGPHVILTPVFLSGTGKHHFESSIGGTLLYDQSSYEIGVSNAEYFGEQIPSRTQYMIFAPAGTLGYRFQKPDGKFIFRTGAGFPDIVYISFGASF